MEERELLLERLELALDRIREIPGEDWQEESLQHWKESVSYTHLTLPTKA